VRIGKSRVLKLGLVTALYLIVSAGAAGEALFRIPIEPILALISRFPFMNISKIRDGIIDQIVVSSKKSSDNH
jgi:hypothetical protein